MTGTLTDAQERSAPPREVDPSGHRSYEIYLRERVGESTAPIKPRQLISAEFLRDPFPVLATLRDHAPCYRDWLGNAFWVTRYDDVTSMLVDDGNCETRTKRWAMGLAHRGRDLRRDLPVTRAWTERVDGHLGAIVDRVVGSTVDAQHPDVARHLAARLPVELLGAAVDVAASELPVFASRYLTMQRGAGWDPAARRDGVEAFETLAAQLDPLVEARRADPGDDLVSAIASLELDGPRATGVDVAATLLEGDHETLHGGLANLWALLLTHPEALERVRDDRRFVGIAWLEALRHSPPVLAGHRYTRHEVERFGRLLPAGALVICSAAAANRDPAVFAEPDRFDLDRGDLTHREARGQHRADGLASGVSVGTGPPSRFPADPKDRPRSAWALTRDVAVAATSALLDAAPRLALVPGAEPDLRSLRLGEMRTCWSLPVTV